VGEIADRVEQFANRFVSKTRVSTARLVSSRRWVETNPDDPSAVAIRKEIATIDPEFTRMLDDLVKLTNDCEAYIRKDELLDASAGLAEVQRIRAAVGAMTAVVKEYAKQRERDTALPKWLTTCGVLRRSDTSSTHVLSLQPASGGGGTDAEFLIGSSRFN
jgi:hypothetical protein